MDYYSPIAIVGNAIGYVYIYLCAFFVLTPKMKLWKILLLSALPMALGYVLPFLFLYEYQLLKSFVGFGLIFLPVLLFYKDKLYKRILFIIMSILVLCVTEVICAFIFPVIRQEDYLLIYFTSLAFVIPLTFLGSVFFYVFNRKKQVNVSVRDRAVMLILPYSQFATLYGWVNYVRDSVGSSDVLSNGVFSLILTVIFCVLADIFLFRTLARSAAAARLEAENEALEKQIASQEKYYSMLDTQFTAIRKIRHDIVNHMYTISALIEEGKSSEASLYAEKYFRDTSAATEKRICASPSANAFLSYKLAELVEHNIRAEFDVTLSDHPGISDVDIITVLGNLLDNAQEACQDIPNAVIKLRIVSENGFIMIYTENPCSQNRQHNERIRGMVRGVGFSILTGIAERYHGSLSHDYTNGIYHCIVSLKTA